MKHEPCDCCGKPAKELIAVKTREATFWDPAEWGLMCKPCIDAERERAEQIEERRGVSDEDWERV